MTFVISAFQMYVLHFGHFSKTGKTRSHTGSKWWPGDPVTQFHVWYRCIGASLTRWQCRRAELSCCRHDTTASQCCSDAGVVQCRGRISWLKQLISAVCWHITVARILHCCRVWSVSQCDLVVAVTYSTLISLKLIVSAAHCQNCDARCAGFICRTQRGLFFVAFSPLPHGGIKNFFVMHQMFQTADVWAACGQPLHTQPFNGPLSRTTRVSRYQKGKTNLDFTEGRDSEWQWHQLGHMQVCISLQTDNHASTPPLSFFTGCLPAAQPTVSKHWRHASLYLMLYAAVSGWSDWCIKQDWHSQEMNLNKIRHG